MYKNFDVLSLALGACLVCVSGHAQQVEEHVEKARPLIRATSNPSLPGTIISKAVDEKNDALFLRVKQNDGSIRDYLLDMKCDETCQKAIESCKGGEHCSIRGKVDEAVPSITPEFVRLGAGTTAVAETKKSQKVDGTVATWTRDTSNPRLGEAWRDPIGMVWGDIVKKKDGSPHFMNHNAADKYCKSIGAELPRREDLIRLREYLGAKPGSNKGYVPQILANLTHDNGRASRNFWSSSLHYDFPMIAFAFNGLTGNIDNHYRIDSDKVSVRCVSARR